MTMPVDGAEVTRLLRVLDEAAGGLTASYRRIAELQAEVARKDRELARRSRLEMLGRMAATLAHEIRNPLGGIQLYAGLLRREVSGPSIGTCDRILAAVRDLNRLVEDMLTYGRDLEPARADCRIEPLLDQAVALAGIEGRLRVVRRYAPLRPVRADASMIGRVFLNLALNAGQAMEEGELVLETGAAGGNARVVFRDSGPGLPQEVLQRLFTPFVTTRAQGTGLGLAIAHKIVEAHGGSIAARNVEPRGAEFTIELPP